MGVPWLLALAPLFLSSQDPGEAQRLYDAMAAKIKAAKTLDLDVHIVEESRFVKRNTQSRHEKDLHLTLGDGERAHLVITQYFSGEKTHQELISDGARLRFTWGELTSAPVVWLDQEMLKPLSSTLVAGLLHYEVGAGLDVRSRKDRKWAFIEEVGTPADLRQKGKELLGDQRAVVLEYSILKRTDFGKSPKRKFQVTLWLDETSSLPLRRVKVEPDETIVETTTETFRSLTLDGPLPEGAFTLPKPTAEENPAKVPGEAEVAAKVRIEIERLTSDDPAVRSAAGSELSALGIRALPLLEPRLNSEDPELRGQVAGVIDRIQRTDPFFLVRPPKRTTTASIKDAPPGTALEQLFRPFPVPPILDRFSGAHAPDRITIDLRQATFWEAVAAFSKATEFKLDFTPFSGPPVFGTRPARTVTYSAPQGSVIAAASATRSDTEVRLRLNLCHEPGGLPIDGEFQLASVTDEQGKDISGSFSAVRSEADERMEKILGRPRRPEVEHDTISHLQVLDLRAPPKAAAVGALLTVRGTGKMTLPTRVESVVFRIQGFKGDEQQGLGELQIRVTKLELRKDSIQFEDGCQGPQNWKAPPGRSYQGSLWVLAADDDGHSAVLGGRGYTTSGGGSSGIPLNHALVPTKICYVRPMDAETIECPVLIEGIVVARE